MTRSPSLSGFSIEFQKERGSLSDCWSIGVLFKQLQVLFVRQNRAANDCELAVMSEVSFSLSLQDEAMLCSWQLEIIETIQLMPLIHVAELQISTQSSRKESDKYTKAA